MKQYDIDRARSDKTIAPILELLKTVFKCSDADITSASFTDDTELNTDVFILGRRVALRMRRTKYLKSFPYDITFRLNKPSGCKTEWEKIRDDYHGHYMVYYFMDDDNEVVAFRIIRLSALRIQLYLRTNEPDQYFFRLTRGHNENDGTEFYAIDTRELLRDCIVGEWHRDNDPAFYVKAQLAPLYP